MSYSGITAQLKTLIESVTGIGKVHDYRRSTKFWGDFYGRHVANQQVNNWEITRRNLASEVFAVQGAGGNLPIQKLTHGIIIYGHLGVNDESESEKKFQTLIGLIELRLREYPFLNGVTIIPGFAQFPVIEYRTFGGVLCHYTEIIYDAIERVGG